jgi:hypothetical protein
MATGVAGFDDDRRKVSPGFWSGDWPAQSLLTTSSSIPARGAGNIKLWLFGNPFDKERHEPDGHH